MGDGLWSYGLMVFLIISNYEKNVLYLLWKTNWLTSTMIIGLKSETVWDEDTNSGVQVDDWHFGRRKGQRLFPRNRFAFGSISSVPASVHPQRPVQQCEWQQIIVNGAFTVIEEHRRRRVARQTFSPCIIRLVLLIRQ